MSSPKTLGAMMRRLCLAISFMMLGVTASQASAQQQFDWNRCTISAQALCFDISLSLTPTQYIDGTAATAFDITVRNLEGTIGNTPYAIFPLSFSNFATDAQDTKSFQFKEPLGIRNGTAGTVFTADSALYCGNGTGICPNPAWGREEWDMLVAGGRGFFENNMGFDVSPLPYAIIGCDVTPQPPYPKYAFAVGYLQTCGDGFFEWMFNAPGNWMADDQTQVGFTYTSLGTQGEVCLPTSSTVATADTGCLATTAAPEPGTLTLAATGLASVVGFARRRRRRRVA